MRDEITEVDASPREIAVTNLEAAERSGHEVHTQGSPPVMMLGVPFHRMTMAGALERIEAMIQSRAPHHIATANVDFLVQARKDAELHRILLNADLILCDSTPLLWASRLLGSPLPQRVAGSDLVPALLRIAARKGHRIFFLGGEPEVASRAMEVIRRDHPALRIAGQYSPPFRPLPEMDHDEICRRIRAAQPDVLCVSFGCPKAEKWIAMHYPKLGVPVAIGIGATIDFLAGRFHRAPLWMQRGGLEWVYRFWQEPRRLGGRYLSDLWHFSGMFLAQWWLFQSLARSGGDGPGALRMAGAPDEPFVAINAPARLDARSLERDQVFWECVNGEPAHCIINLSRVQCIDSAGVGLLVQLRHARHQVGRQLVLLECTDPVRSAFKSHRLEGWFTCAANLPEALRLIDNSTLHDQTV